MLSEFFWLKRATAKEASVPRSNRLYGTAKSKRPCCFFLPWKMLGLFQLAAGFHEIKSATPDAAGLFYPVRLSTRNTGRYQLFGNWSTRRPHPAT